MKSIYDQINNNEVLIYPENVTATIKQIDTASFTNDQALDAYFPEDTYEVIPEIHFDKVEIGDGNFIYHGDNMDVLRSLPDNSIDSIVTDPPYGIKYYKAKWDHDVPRVEFWKECFRVLKPGGYVLSFGSSKTYHRMAVNVEDAGFEIRDQIMWIFGSGFPKSHNLGLSIDKALGHENRGHRIATASRTHPDGTYEPNGQKLPPYNTKSKEAKPYEGFGTNLKPAHEPILIARKPFKGSVAKNVLVWGTGGINIDRCRIVENQEDISIGQTTPVGRFPANILFDQFSCEILDEQAEVNVQGKNGKKKINPSKFFYCSKPSKKEKEEGLTNEEEVIKGRDEGQDNRNVSQKLTTTKRKNTHITVKPVSLMEYLISLVTPLGGITLDPFFGSGTSGKSIVAEGDYKFIGIEKERKYFDIAVGRCQYEFHKCNKTAA
jgi:DNA modification methylase